MNPCIYIYVFEIFLLNASDLAPLNNQWTKCAPVVSSEAQDLVSF